MGTGRQARRQGVQASTSAQSITVVYYEPGKVSVLALSSVQDSDAPSLSELRPAPLSASG
jgi:hypothetical protein